MSKSTIALFSAVLVSTMPVISSAWAEGEQAAVSQSAQAGNPAVPAPQIEMPESSARAPDADDDGSASPETPDAGEAPQSEQPSAINPDGETAPAQPKGKYDKSSFFADFKQFHIGDIAPESYRQPHYKIGEWQKRHLTPPEEGSHWTYMGGDYVLITDAEGKILKVLSGDIIYQ
ncbi:RcnB family protein [Pantoea sp. FN060301]|uniref:RcnB family protein n=1 Tax=Pantoea sp. FN060301 TaxID=3420380 RepID=UPI003D173841